MAVAKQHFTKGGVWRVSSLTLCYSVQTLWHPLNFCKTKISWVRSLTRQSVCSQSPRSQLTQIRHYFTFTPSFFVETSKLVSSRNTSCLSLSLKSSCRKDKRLDGKKYACQQIHILCFPDSLYVKCIYDHSYSVTVALTNGYLGVACASCVVGILGM